MSELRILEKEERVGKKVISASGLVEFMKSPKHFYSKYVLKEIEPSQAMEDGKTVHMAILERERFKKEYLVLDDKSSYLETVDDLKTALEKLGQKPEKGNKKVLIDQLLKAQPDVKIWDDYISKIDKSKKVISAKDYRDIERLIEEVEKHEWLKRLPENKTNEVPGYFVHKSGVHITFRLDSLFFGKHGRPIIIDLKKSRSASPDYFSKTIYNNTLYVQAAIYVDAIKEITGVEPLYCWVVVEDTAPYCIEVYAADSGTLSAGHNVYNKMINKFINCSEKNVWPSYTNGEVNSIAMPPWAFGKLDEFAEMELEHE